jgi:hypothetical protein
MALIGLPIEFVVDGAQLCTEICSVAVYSDRRQSAGKCNIELIPEVYFMQYTLNTGIILPSILLL